MLSMGAMLPGGTSGSLNGDLQWSGGPNEKSGLGRACAVPDGRGKVWIWETEQREEQPVKVREAVRNGDSTHSEHHTPGSYNRQVFTRDGST